MNLSISCTSASNLRSGRKCEKFAAEKTTRLAINGYKITRNCPMSPPSSLFTVVLPRVVTRSKLLPLTKRFYVRRSGPARRDATRPYATSAALWHFLQYRHYQWCIRVLGDFSRRLICDFAKMLPTRKNFKLWKAIRHVHWKVIN